MKITSKEGEMDYTIIFLGGGFLSMIFSNLFLLLQKIDKDEDDMPGLGISLKELISAFAPVFSPLFSLGSVFNSFLAFVSNLAFGFMTGDFSIISLVVLACLMLVSFATFLLGTSVLVSGKMGGYIIASIIFYVLSGAGMWLILSNQNNKMASPAMLPKF